MKPRILIVEDSVLINQHLKTLIENAGYVVCGVCPCGEDAIEVAKTKGPDLVFMDITLAGAMDGVTAARIITNSIPAQIVFLTALATSERLDDQGDFKSIVKLFDDSELLDMLAQFRFKKIV